MTLSSSVLLDEAFRSLPPELSPTTFTALVRQRVREFPARADILGLEIRPAERCGEIDLTFGASTPGALSSFRKRSGSFASLLAAARADRTDPLIGKLKACVPTAGYLEYDMDEGARNCPSSFVRTSWLTRNWRERRAVNPLFRLLKSTWSGEQARTLKTHLDRVLERAPRNFLVHYVGVMARAGEPLRLSTWLPDSDVTGFLSALGWQGWHERHDWILRLAQRAAWIDLAIGIGPNGLANKIGIEIKAEANGRRSAESILGSLRARGLCGRSASATIGSWLRHPPSCRLTRRSLSHAKVSIDRHGAISAKIYLAVESTLS